VKEIPRQIGRYRIERELGRGAMGVVYDAFDPDLDRHVALKTIHLDRISGEGLADCLRREAKSIARLDHPNIVTLYDAGEIGSVYYLVLQLVDGETLSARMRRWRAIPVREAVGHVLQLLSALDYAHNRGLVHRDVKPANVMIGADGVVKLMDFGIARLVGADLTNSGMIMGTPDYMSPEQILGEPADGRSDIFSVGCTLYELIAGRKPFAATDAVDVMNRVVYGQPAPLEPELHRVFEELFARALAKAPDQRFQTCSQFAASLRKCLSEVEVPRTLSLTGLRLRTLKPVFNSPIFLVPVLAMALLQKGNQIKAQPVRNPPKVMREAVVPVLPASLVDAPATPAETTAPVEQHMAHIEHHIAMVPNRGEARSAPPVILPPHLDRSLVDATSFIDAAATPAVKTPRVEQPMTVAASPDEARFATPATFPPSTPGSTLARHTDTCDSLIMAGDEAFREGRYDVALAKYAEASRLDPRSSLAKKKLSVALTILGRGEESIDGNRRTAGPVRSRR
jgi:serine/threonine protein kinase